MHNVLVVVWSCFELKREMVVQEVEVEQKTRTGELRDIFKLRELASRPQRTQPERRKFMGTVEVVALHHYWLKIRRNAVYTGFRHILKIELP